MNERMESIRTETTTKTISANQPQIKKPTSINQKTFNLSPSFVYDAIQQQLEQHFSKLYSGGLDLNITKLVQRTHLQNDGYICYCRKKDGKFENVGAFLPAELDNEEKKLKTYLEEDAYFSVNSFFKCRNRNKSGFKTPLRRENNLRRLNALYCDLDYYHSDLEFRDVLDIVIKMQREGVIPCVSIVANSGRGMYLIWLLTGNNSKSPPMSFNKEFKLYKVIEKHLIKTINNYDARLNADTQACDAARLLRVPGSINTKSSSAVNYYPVINYNTGLHYDYTLTDVAKFLQIPKEGKGPSKKPSFSIARNPGSAAARRNGPIETAKRRIADILIIQKNTDIFQRGRRRKLLVICAYILKCIHKDKSKVLRELKKIADKCNPPYPSDNSDSPLAIMVKASDPRLFKDEYLANYFKISKKFAIEHNLKQIIPIELKEERKREKKRGSERKRTQKKMEIENRRNLVKNYPTLSVREVAEKLRKDHDIVVGKSTIANDIAFLKRHERLFLGYCA
jgi:hypothetical protein